MVQRYSNVAIVLHWLVAALIVTNVALAWIWPVLPDAQVRPAIDLHKSIGITILGLALLRILWRFGHRPPPLPRGYAGWEVAASHIVHWGLYAILFAMPLTGWIMDSAWKDAETHPMHWFGLFEWPRIAFFEHLAPATRDHMHDLFGAGHVWGAYALYTLFFLHVGGALKHQWLDGEAELQRMWPSPR